MKRVKKSKQFQMLEEYDFSGGERGRYAKRYLKGTNIVVLEPDLAKKFPNSKSVNQALRTLSEIIRQSRSVSI